VDRVEADRREESEEVEESRSSACGGNGAGCGDNWRIESALLNVLEVLNRLLLVNLLGSCSRKSIDDLLRTSMLLVSHESSVRSGSVSTKKGLLSMFFSVMVLRCA